MGKETILCVVSANYGNYGDFLFALKLANKIKKEYIDSVGKSPDFYIVTEDEGKKKIERLQGDKTFGIAVLTPQELKQKIDHAFLEIIHIFEGPVFDEDLIKHVDAALKNTQLTNQLIPLTMFPEYSCRISPEDRQKTPLKKIKYKNILYSGLDNKNDELGIFLNENLSLQEALKKLDPKISEIVFGTEDIQDYQENTELYLQYSHDTHDFYTHRYISYDFCKGKLISDANATNQFLNIHRAFVKGKKKNQDIIMIGEKERKLNGLKQIFEALKKDGFNEIEFYDGETRETKILLQNDAASIIPTKKYRALFFSHIPNASMLACITLSGPLMGATGDQSFGEAFSAQKIIIYECIFHKEAFSIGYNQAMIEASHQDKDIIEIITLLNESKSTDEFDRLGDLLRNPVIQKKLNEISWKLVGERDLAKAIAKKLQIGSTPTNQLMKFLNTNKKEEALDFFLKTTEKINIRDIISLNTFWNDIISHPESMRFLEKIIKNIQTNEERSIFCRKLMEKNIHGTSYLNYLQRAFDPKEKEYELIDQIGYLLIREKINLYKPRSEKHAKIHTSFQERFDYLEASCHYNKNALVGLLIEKAKEIKSEYKLFSPKKGSFFGSTLYSLYADSLKDLGIDFKNLAPKDLEYYANALQAEFGSIANKH